MYQIKYSYNTGDSFGTSENQRDILPYKWNDINRAKESLQRIKEHYTYYMDLNDYHWRAKKREDVIAAAKKQPWYVKKYDFCLKLVDDAGKDFEISTNWCGYFESLNWAEIEPIPRDKSNNMRIEF